MNEYSIQSLEYLCSYFTKLIKQSDYKKVFNKNDFSRIEYYLEIIDQDILKGINIYNEIKKIGIGSNFEVRDLFIYIRIFAIDTKTNINAILAMWRTYNKHYKKGTFRIPSLQIINIQDPIFFIQFLQQMIELIDQLTYFLKEPLGHQVKKNLSASIKQVEIAYSSLHTLANVTIPDIRFVPTIIAQATKHLELIFRYWKQIDWLREQNFKKYARTVDFSYKSLS